MNFVSLITSKLAGPIASALLVLSIVGNIGLGLNLRAERHAYSALLEDSHRQAADLATCKLNASRLEGSLAAQNASVDALKSAADVALAGAKAGQAAAETAAAGLDRTAADLAHASPAPGADHCAAASTLIRTTLAGEHAK